MTEPNYGALREAIARSLIAEQLAEAALGELARVAELTQEQAAAGLVAVAEWIPGEQITDEQCQAFQQAAQTQPSDTGKYQDLIDATVDLLQNIEDANQHKDHEGRELPDVAATRAALNALGVTSV